MSETNIFFIKERKMLKSKDFNTIITELLELSKEFGGVNDFGYIPESLIKRVPEIVNMNHFRKFKLDIVSILKDAKIGLQEGGITLEIVTDIVINAKTVQHWASNNLALVGEGMLTKKTYYFPL